MIILECDYTYIHRVNSIISEGDYTYKQRVNRKISEGDPPLHSVHLHSSPCGYTKTIKH